MLSRYQPRARWDDLEIRASIDSLTLVRDLAAGTFEPYSTRLFKEIVRPGMTVVDVGACIGIYSMLAARNGATVLAFEPDKRNQHDLRENLQRNHLSGVTVIGKAAYASPGVQDWHARRPAGHSGLFADYEDYFAVTQVETVRLDQLIDRCDVLKIDVEGAELDVLEGAGGLLADARLLIEYAPYVLEVAGRSGDELLARLRDTYKHVKLVDEKAGRLVPFVPVRLGNLYCHN
jgi:FkbM family methyltransferase